MKIDLDDEFFDLLGEIVRFIAKDKPLAARKFKKDLISAVRKDLKFPYNYKMSIYYKDDSFRDYVFNVIRFLIKFSKTIKLFEFLESSKTNILIRKKLHVKINRRIFKIIQRRKSKLDCQRILFQS